MAYYYYFEINSNNLTIAIIFSISWFIVVIPTKNWPTAIILARGWLFK